MQKHQSTPKDFSVIANFANCQQTGCSWTVNKFTLGGSQTVHGLTNRLGHSLRVDFTDFRLFCGSCNDLSVNLQMPYAGCVYNRAIVFEF